MILVRAFSHRFRAVFLPFFARFPARFVPVRPTEAAQLNQNISKNIFVARLRSRHSLPVLMTTGRASRRKPVAREHGLHAQVAALLTVEVAPAGRASADGVVWFSVDHAAYGGAVPGARVGRGIVGGVPDIVVLHRGCVYFIELKAEAGVLSDAQRSFAYAVLASSGRVGVATCAEHVLACLDGWSIPRARRTRL